MDEKNYKWIKSSFESFDSDIVPQEDAVGQNDYKSEFETTDVKIVEKLFTMRHDFVLIGLTGRTGSGCSTIAEFLAKENFAELKSNYRKKNQGDITNETRKDGIVYNYIKENWKEPFTIISASDIIFYFVLLEEFDTFKNALLAEKEINDTKGKFENSFVDNELKKRIEGLKEKYGKLYETAKDCDGYIEGNEKYDEVKVKKCRDLIFSDIKDFRKNLLEAVGGSNKKIISIKLQEWGNNIRKYNSIKKNNTQYAGSSCLAHKINQFVKRFREDYKAKGLPTYIVIDALRNPFEILYFRERYAAFYLMAVHTEEKVRREKLYNKGYGKEEIDEIDKNEREKKNFDDSYSKLDIDKCIELADIHLTHDGIEKGNNRDLVNQLFTYIALIFHPGLVPPTPLERVMQVAYTAKLNSGCLSRQVGAAVTNEFYSVQSIGWNTVAEGQVPCSLRCLCDLCNKEDETAFSNYEKSNENFVKKSSLLFEKYKDVGSLKGVNLSYCFKDVHTSITKEQDYNQVHTRSLHAEENAFLQLAKYGTQGIKCGKLFTTASCCELCAKKAYQLGIKEIYYIDAYPSISKPHILESGINQPEMILFRGAIGRAYINLYSQFLPLKDEIEELSGVRVKALLRGNKGEENREKEYGNNSEDK